MSTSQRMFLQIMKKSQVDTLRIRPLAMIALEDCIGRFRYTGRIIVLIYNPRWIMLSFIYGGTWFDSKQYSKDTGISGPNVIYVL